MLLKKVLCIEEKLFKGEEINEEEKLFMKERFELLDSLTEKEMYEREDEFTFEETEYFWDKILDELAERDSRIKNNKEKVLCIEERLFKGEEISEEEKLFMKERFELLDSITPEEMYERDNEFTFEEIEYFLDKVVYKWALDNNNK